ncbi:enoyl-CoA hydratase/isomerase family protein [Dictyocaulus viviparus]|uniref:Delta(3,5)-Delta(2,4)-dienoyl-CoA isomerase, mitochondrial n=1 Tax=Dictyocaulus viviparus TaxID=29172 RepID=A0A0D8XFE9_DICVI|nr:enoyl-CoA hydratase/isomerase family protein [Dictyocaulus viviparus]
MFKLLTNRLRYGCLALRHSGTLIKQKAGLEVYEASTHVYHIKLNRPHCRNTFTLELWKNMELIFGELSDDPNCRSIVISGIGKSFCAGIDLQQGMRDLTEVLMNDKVDIGRKGRALRNIITICQDGFSAIEKCPKPVIAAIHSHCLGAGIDLVTACDIRYASSDSIFSIKEVDIGMAADVGTLNRIQKIVGNDSWSRELAFTARDVGAEEALKFGLISRIFDTQESVVQGALALAERIAKKSPVGVQGSKVVLNYARDHTVEDSLNFVKTWNMSQLQSMDLRNSAMAVLNKQKLEYENL